MLKLKKSVVEFIKANVRPSLVEKWIKRIENASTDSTPSYWRFDKHETITRVEFSLTVAPIDFDEVEDLKLGVWYPREKFDGNPNGWLILEQSYYGSYKSVDFELGFLFDDTARFMYVNHPEMKEDED